MRIAVFVWGFPGISEPWLLNHVVGLIKQGNEVSIFAISKDDSKKTHPDVERYDLMSRTFELEHIPSSRVARVIKGLYLLGRHFHKRPATCLRALNIFRYGKRAASLNLFYSAIPFLSARSFDLVHCHFGPLGVMAAGLKDIGVFKCPVVTSFHGLDVNVQPRMTGRACYKDLFRSGDAYTAVSTFARKKLVSLGAGESKVTLWPMGVNTGRFAFRVRHHEEGGNVRLLSVGRLAEVKGIEYGLRAVAKVIQRYPNVLYQIVGDGPRRVELENLSKRLGIASQVKFMGPVTHDDLPSIYGDAHILVFPSVVDGDGGEEALPVVLLEAQASGLPIVASRTGGVPEALREGQSGFLVPPRDADAMASQIVHLIEHPELWSRMGWAGRRHVEEQYDVELLNARMAELYQRLLTSAL